MAVTLTPAENFLTDDDLGSIRSAIRSVASETFGRQPFSALVPVRLPAEFGETAQYSYDQVDLTGLFLTVGEVLSEDEHAPVDLDADAVLLLSLDYLRDRTVGAADIFAEKRDRDLLIQRGDLVFRASRIEQTGMLADTYLLLMCSLKRAAVDE